MVLEVDRPVEVGLSSLADVQLNLTHQNMRMHPESIFSPVSKGKISSLRSERDGNWIGASRFDVVRNAD